MTGGYKGWQEVGGGSLEGEAKSLCLIKFCWWCGWMGNVIPTFKQQGSPLCSIWLDQNHVFKF